MVSNVLNVMKSLRNLSESNEFETNARADVKYQYETFKYSSKSPATTRIIQIYVYLRSLFNTLHVSKKPNIGQTARDVSSSNSILIEPRVAEVAREHGWHPPKSLDSNKNF